MILVEFIITKKIIIRKILKHLIIYDFYTIHYYHKFVIQKIYKPSKNLRF